MTHDPDAFHFEGAPIQRGDPMKREPVLTVATVTALIGSVVALLVAFGLPLSPEQQTAILGVATVAAPLVVALFSRPRVTPVTPTPRGQVGESLVTVGAFVVLILLAVVIVVKLL